MVKIIQILKEIYKLRNTSFVIVKTKTDIEPVYIQTNPSEGSFSCTDFPVVEWQMYLKVNKHQYEWNYDFNNASKFSFLGAIFTRRDLEKKETQKTISYNIIPYHEEEFINDVTQQ